MDGGAQSSLSSSFFCPVQECLEGLLYRRVKPKWRSNCLATCIFCLVSRFRYHAHRWNVDDLMGAALPHHACIRASEFG